MIDDQKKNNLKVSVIMPIHNGETTLKEALASLLGQTDFFQELIIINDASTDNSAKIISEFAEKFEKFRIIANEKNLGLAKSYNVGIQEAKGDLVITMHADMVLEKNAVAELLEPFSDPHVAAAGHSDNHPLDLWKKYNFWQKCFFSRFQKLNISGINGQFDCFRKSALEKVGLFDGFHYKSAGEDGDMVWKLKKIGKVVASKARTIHIHKVDPNFSWRDIIHKQAQYSEAQGALLARGRISGMYQLAKSFFREILLIALLIPFINIISIIIIIIYSFSYTGRVFVEEYKNPRILILPFFNIFLLFVSLVYSLKGFILGKQTI